MSDATVQVPAVGRVKKQYVIAGAALVAGIVGYAYWRAAQAPADLPAYTEEDVISDGVTDTAGGVAGGSANSGGTSVDNSTTPDTDAEWVQLSRDALAGVFDDAALSIALGRYIGRESLTAAQADMVRAAIGSIGYPPGGKYPIDTTTGSTPSALTEPKNLRQWSSPQGTAGPDFIALEWDAVPGATGYRVFRGLGENVGDSFDTKFYARGLEPNKSYSFVVKATANGKEGPASSKKTFKTKAYSFSKPSAPVVSGITRTSAKVTTRPMTGGKSYRWYLNGQLSNVTDAPTWTFSGLRPNTTYRVEVSVDHPNQGPSPRSSVKSFKTKK